MYYHYLLLSSLEICVVPVWRKLIPFIHLCFVLIASVVEIKLAQRLGGEHLSIKIVPEVLEKEDENLKSLHTHGRTDNGRPEKLT